MIFSKRHQYVMTLTPKAAINCGEFHFCIPSIIGGVKANALTHANTEKTLLYSVPIILNNSQIITQYFWASNEKLPIKCFSETYVVIVQKNIL